MLKRLLFLTLLLLPLPQALAGAAPAGHGAVSVGYYDFPPYIYSDAHGQVTGRGAELMRRLLEHAGYRADFHALPSARLYQALRDGSVQLWAGAPGKPELAGFTLECQRSLGEIELSLYRLPNRPAPRLPFDLRGKRLILISGYNYWKPVTQFLEDPQLQLNLHRTSTHAAALQMLMLGRGDYLLDYQGPVEQTRIQLGLPELPHERVFRLPVTLIISRQTPDAEQLRQRLDAAYDELSAEGERFYLD
ncbi:MAG: hypothetical protein GAK43_02564 [Stenotrophomonas maltophilia]|nr:MAG: hypothetical protein GAK43_02564 [Stenotrophomonas maltophilia]